MSELNNGPTFPQEKRYAPSMEQLERREVLKGLVDALESEKIRYAIMGGYGIDGLYGELTRDHGDIDLLVHDDDAGRVRTLLPVKGFVVEQIKGSEVEAYRHPLGNTKLEVAYLGLMKKYTDSDEASFFVDEPNASLGGFRFRTATLDGHVVAKEVQSRRAREGGWGEYPHAQSTNTLIREIRLKEIKRV